MNGAFYVLLDEVTTHDLHLWLCEMFSVNILHEFFRNRRSLMPSACYPFGFPALYRSIQVR